MISAFDTWRISMATKMHFESDGYDAFRFCFKAKNLSCRAFEMRKDRYFFEKLSKKLKTFDDARRYAFANIFFLSNTWIGSMTDDPYKDYCKRVQTFSYRLKQDLQRLPEIPLDSLLVPPNGKPPILIQRYLEGDLMAETVMIINGLTHFIDIINDKVLDTMLWPEIKKKLDKGTAFVLADIDKDKSKKIVVDHFIGFTKTNQ